MPRRTFGWVQNPNNLATLRKVVCALIPKTDENIWLISERLPLLKENNFITSKDYADFINALSGESYKYTMLKGRGSGSHSRANAICSGIVQAIIDGQKTIQVRDLSGSIILVKKPYTDDWSASGFISWAVAVGFLLYDPISDTCSLSENGKLLSTTRPDSPQEQRIIENALLSYPPVIRVLDILSTDPDSSLTKFEVGCKLGFKGEKGFTSIPQDYFIAACMDTTFTPAERDKAKQNLEGDSDKYVRTIASWLNKFGWLKNCHKDIKTVFLGNEYTMEEYQSYQITIQGLQALRKSKSHSGNGRIAKRVFFEMLATKAPNKDFLRKRRALILEALSKNSGSIDKILKYEKNNGIETCDATIRDDIEGLCNIGINISEIDGSYRLLDKIIALQIPEDVNSKRDDLTFLKDRIRSNIKSINHNYLTLVDLAYSGKNSDAREFEFLTAEFFTNELGFDGLRLGDSNRPDVIIYKDKDGSIIDNKSYSSGFTIPRGTADEMIRYIDQNERRIERNPPNEWWKNFPEFVNAFSYIFISSYFAGNFLDKLAEIAVTHPHTPGAALNIENLLYIGDLIKSGAITHADFFRKTRNNNEIIL